MQYIFGPLALSALLSTVPASHFVRTCANYLTSIGNASSIASDARAFDLSSVSCEISNGTGELRLVTRNSRGVRFIAFAEYRDDVPVDLLLVSQRTPFDRLTVKHLDLANLKNAGEAEDFARGWDLVTPVKVRFCGLSAGEQRRLLETQPFAVRP